MFHFYVYVQFFSRHTIFSLFVIKLTKIGCHSTKETYFIMFLSDIITALVNSNTGTRKKFHTQTMT